MRQYNREAATGAKTDAKKLNHRDHRGHRGRHGEKMRSPQFQAQTALSGSSCPRKSIPFFFASIFASSRLRGLNQFPGNSLDDDGVMIEKNAEDAELRVLPE
jgi:hypothetical protein